jgi:hypothetical protein
MWPTLGLYLLGNILQSCVQSKTDYWLTKQTKMVRRCEPLMKHVQRHARTICTFALHPMCTKRSTQGQDWLVTTDVCNDWFAANRRRGARKSLRDNK